MYQIIGGNTTISIENKVDKSEETTIAEAVIATMKVHGTYPFTMKFYIDGKFINESKQQRLRVHEGFRIAYKSGEYQIKKVVYEAVDMSLVSVYAETIEVKA